MPCSFNNGDSCKEFVVDEHYIGHACNRLAPSFRVFVDCQEGYMIIVRVGDEEHPNPYCW